MADRFSKKTWWVIRLTLDPKAEEPVSTVLWDAGTVGISSSLTTDWVILTAYFSERPDLHQLRRKVKTYLSLLGVPDAHLARIEEERLVEQDWLQTWKEGYHPLIVGERFIITPSWENPKDPGPRLVIEIDPGMAFGTGTHATTQLCLVAIEQYWRGGRFLDVGTGTGILAIAAAQLHPDAQVVAVDVDPSAIEVARENLIRNRVAENIVLLLGSIEDVSGQQFDLIVANLTADIIEEQLPQMTHRLAGDGVLILSGVLAEQEEAVQLVATRVGLCVVDRFASEEWLAVVGHAQVGVSP